SAQRLVVKASAGFSGKLKPVVTVVSEQKRAKSGTTAFRAGVAAYHHFLFVYNFKFQPLRGAAACVGGIGPFGDQTFPAEAAGFLKIRLAFIGQMRRITA